MSLPPGQCPESPAATAHKCANRCRQVTGSSSVQHMLCPCMPGCPCARNTVAGICNRWHISRPPGGWLLKRLAGLAGWLAGWQLCLPPRHRGWCRSGALPAPARYPAALPPTRPCRIQSFRLQAGVARHGRRGRPATAVGASALTMRHAGAMRLGQRLCSPASQCCNNTHRAGSWARCWLPAGRSVRPA